MAAVSEDDAADLPGSIHQTNAIILGDDAQDPEDFVAEDPDSEVLAAEENDKNEDIRNEERGDPEGIAGDVVEDEHEEKGFTTEDGSDSLDKGAGSTQGVQHGCCYRCLSFCGCGCVARLPETWPRTFGIILGVIVPLFSLIFVSLLFGYFLAKLEAPGEIEANNEIIASKSGFELASGFVNNMTTFIPSMCTSIFILHELDRHNETKMEVAIEYAMDLIFLTGYDRNDPPELGNKKKEIPPTLDDVNTTELLEFMLECGEMAQEQQQNFTSALAGVADLTLYGEDITFNWIRCDDLGNNTDSSLLEDMWNGLWMSFRPTTTPDIQEEYVVNEWKEQQEKLYRTYFNESQKDGITKVESQVDALIRSYEEASGFETCNENTAAGAWFWFTVMTTIGYGNTAPVTVGGRAMIYSLGFFSILLFAAILGRAGVIVTAIFDDGVRRMRLDFLAFPSVSCILWGSLYYGWMVVIALCTQSWKKIRLEEDMGFDEAYWFSYISTTTVGLGDYFLEHGAIILQDLFTFPVLFLFGFVLLANFLVNLQEMVMGWFPSNRPTFEDNLKASHTRCCHRTKKVEEAECEEYLQEEGVPKEVEIDACASKTTTSVDIGDGWKGVVSVKAAEISEE